MYYCNEHTTDSYHQLSQFLPSKIQEDRRYYDLENLWFENGCEANCYQNFKENL